MREWRLPRRLKKALCTATLAVTPWMPGLAAFPLLVSSSPVQGQALPAGAAADTPAVGGDAGAAGADPRERGTTPPAPPVGPPTPAESAAAPATASAGPPPPPPGLPAPAPGEVWVDVSLSEQTVRVYREQELLREMIASTGTPESPTPRGSFRLENRGEWFFSPKYRQGGWWWVSFLNRGQYLFHGVPTDENRRVIQEEAARLGTPASHGCIRLAMADARWFFETLPEGTRVEIRP